MIRYSEEIKEQVRKEVQAGQSQREISRRYGISGYTVQSWCGLKAEAGGTFTQRPTGQNKDNRGL